MERQLAGQLWGSGFAMPGQFNYTALAGHRMQESDLRPDGDGVLALKDPQPYFQHEVAVKGGKDYYVFIRYHHGKSFAEQYLKVVGKFEFENNAVKY